MCRRRSRLEQKSKQFLDQGQFYERVAKNPIAALRAYESVLELYPKSQHVVAAQVRIDKLREHSVKSVVEEISE